MGNGRYNPFPTFLFCNRRRHQLNHHLLRGGGAGLPRLDEEGGLWMLVDEVLIAGLPAAAGGLQGDEECRESVVLHGRS